jgi:hypothetical protein
MFCLIHALSYRPETNAAILLDMGHTKGRPWTGAICHGKEAKNLNVVYVLIV